MSGPFGDEPRFVTQFEKAKQLGISPEEVKRAALNSELGDFGMMGGVVYLATKQGDTAFFEDLLVARWGLKAPTVDTAVLP